MLKQFLSPALSNAAGWLAAGAVVFAWQYYESNKSKAVDDPTAFNQAIIDSSKKKK